MSQLKYSLLEMGTKPAACAGDCCYCTVAPARRPPGLCPMRRDFLPLFRTRRPQIYTANPFPLFFPPRKNSPFSSMPLTSCLLFSFQRYFIYRNFWIFSSLYEMSLENGLQCESHTGRRKILVYGLGTAKVQCVLKVGSSHPVFPEKM